MRYDDCSPTDLVRGRGPADDYTPTYAGTALAAAQYETAQGDVGMFYVGTTYCANASTVDYARKLERERAERDAARRREYLERQTMRAAARPAEAA